VGALAAPLNAASKGIVVLTGGSAAAYDEAMDGFRTRSAAVTVVNLARSVEVPQNTELLVTMGANALAKAAAESNGTPVLATMVLEDEIRPLRVRPRSALSIDVRPAALLPKLRRLFPGKTRLAIIPNRETPAALRAELAAQAQNYGYDAEVIGCETPKDVLDAVAARRNRADFLWCLPDRSLYQASTVGPLILASLRGNLPIVGFSESFVKAGALVGAYANYREVGVQAADLASDILAGRPAPDKELARAIRVSVSERVLRVLGIAVAGGSEEVEWVR
jgi:hypothetical protein